MKFKNRFLNLWLLIAILSGFGLAIFFIINYVQTKYLCELNCSHSKAIIISMVLVSITGLFVGSLMYYLISEKYKKEIIQIQKDSTATLRFLSADQKLIVKYLIDNKAFATQSKISKDLGVSKVKISRTIKSLIEKKIVKKKESGMTNMISLREDIKDIFLN